MPSKDAVVQKQSEFTCECGSHFVKLNDGTYVCARTVERFKALHGYEPGRNNLVKTQ